VSQVSPFTPEEEQFRRTVRSFLDRELEPHYKSFEAAGAVPREFWHKAGAAGILGPTIPEAHGGPGASEICYAIVSTELRRSIGSATIGSAFAIDLSTHMLVLNGTAAQLARLAPGILAGETIPALGLTEPDAGSDATAIRTTAVRDGDRYLIDGSKTYITNGNSADLIYVVAKTDPTARGRGMSVLLLEGNPPGLTRRRLKTMGHAAGDLAELHFDRVAVPAANLLGQEGGAMPILMSTFAAERLGMGAGSLGAAELAFQLTLDWVKQRKAFGQTLSEFQNTRFRMAELKAEIETGRALLHEGIRKCRAGEFSLADGAIMKLWLCEMEGRVLDACVQLFGGAGWMDEMPISRLYTAARLQRIYGGTSELQKIAIAKTLFG
jgi:alkylation response protein AidB-like acyl-CoA dehydrogenase